uniref:AB hydrolase-1 domain-containing protein n=1 Tax=Chenopodium quinoa TaxID=63459 RepID=A0A803M9I2_CHEQI
MDKISHRKIPVNGINMHIAEIGDPTKPTILFLHGFPELWYSWRHQLLSAAAAGYRAVVPDLRGYGFVGGGHDWGAIIAWHLSLFRPDRIKALVNLSVPFSPRNPNRKPVDGLRNSLGDDFYICRFQEPGEIEEEFSSIDTARLMKQFLLSRDPKPPCIPKGKLAASAQKAITLPPWLSEDDINYYAEKFKQTGFTGALNYYRAMNLTWELMAPWTGVQVKVPVKFIVGELDVTYSFPYMKDYLHKSGFKRDVPLLAELVVMEGAAHFTNQEKPEEISNHILEFFEKF